MQASDQRIRLAGNSPGPEQPADKLADSVAVAVPGCPPLSVRREANQRGDAAACVLRGADEICLSANRAGALQAATYCSGERISVAECSSAKLAAHRVAPLPSALATCLVRCPEHSRTASAHNLLAERIACIGRG